MHDVIHVYGTPNECKCELQCECCSVVVMLSIPYILSVNGTKGVADILIN